jgi:hypothetical protein
LEDTGECYDGEAGRSDDCNTGKFQGTLLSVLVG